MKKLIPFIYLFFFLIAISVLSCNNKKNYQSIVESWLGKQLSLDTLKPIVYTGDTTSVCSFPNGYKILSYIGKDGCTSCKMNLPFWKEYIKEIDRTYKNHVAVILYVSPRFYQDAVCLLKQAEYREPVVIDTTDALNKKYKFPKERLLQTFLLDPENKIVAVGNPIGNKHLKKLYHNIVNKDKPLKTYKLY